MIKVITVTTCNKCKTEHVRDGAEGGCPPVGWYSLELTERHKGEGWTNHRTFRQILCPNCGEEVKKFIEANKYPQDKKLEQAIDQTVKKIVQTIRELNPEAQLTTIQIAALIEEVYGR